MTTATLTSHDITLRDDVLRQLNWDLYLDASDIGVTVHDGAVTLMGVVDTVAAKLEAERAAKRAYGVRAVANELQVRVQLTRTDADIAADIAHMFANRASAIPPTVQATVHEGHVTLTGFVIRDVQRRAAENAIRPISGIKDVANRIWVA
jgi:osmotically-inducible protein OsmY